MSAEPLWFYEPGSPEWELLVDAAADDTDWDALEADARPEGLYWGRARSPHSGQLMPLNEAPATLEAILDLNGHTGWPVEVEPA